MAEKKELATFDYDGGTFLVEVDRVKGSGAKRAALGDTDEMVAEAKETFENAIDKVVPVAAKAVQRIRKGLTEPADAVEVKFGIKLNVEAGAIITSVGGEANFEVVLKWDNSSNKSIQSTSNTAGA